VRETAPPEALGLAVPLVTPANHGRGELRARWRMAHYLRDRTVRSGAAEPATEMAA
jgi:hypothetical protein